MKAITTTKMFTLALASLFITGLSQPSFALTNEETPVEFKVISNVNNSPLFELKANNKEENVYILRVKDANGQLIYSETIKGTNILRKYKLDLSEADTNDALNLRFEVQSVNTKETFVYNVRRNRTVVDDVIVAKL